MGKKGQKQLTVGQYEKALRSTNGFHTQAAKKLGVTQSAVSQMVKKHKSLQRVVKELEEDFLDTAESALLTNIKDGDNTAIIFALKCKGKDRGYVERQEITGADGGELTVKIVKKRFDGK